MKNSTQKRKVRPCHFLLESTIFVIVFILAMNGWALASDQLARLHVETGRLTGHLMQVPLRAVLSQLHDQLGIDYVAPDAELKKVISVTLHKEPVISALSKILAPWDYALTVNASGKIKTLYLTAKASTELSREDSMGKGGKSKTEKRKVNEIETHTWSDHESGKWREDQLISNAPISEPSTSERTATRLKEFTSLSGFMEIRPPASGTSMPVLPAAQKGMQITPGGSARSMDIIPSTAYPPMTIQPVPEHVQREMLLSLHP